METQDKPAWKGRHLARLEEVVQKHSVDPCFINLQRVERDYNLDAETKALKTKKA